LEKIKAGPFEHEEGGFALRPLIVLMLWLQTLPIVPLTFFPFRDQAMRYRRSVCILLMSAYMLVGCLLVAAVSWGARAGQSRNRPPELLATFLLLAGYFALWSPMIRAPRVQKVLVGGIMVHYAAVLSCLGSMASALIFDGADYTAASQDPEGSLSFLWCLGAATLLTWPLMWRFTHRLLPRGLNSMDIRETRRGVGYMLAALFLFCSTGDSIPYEAWPANVILMAALAFTDVIVYYIFFQDLLLTRQQVVLNHQVEFYQLQYRQTVRSINENRRLCHDMRHHLNMIGALNAQGDREGISGYLKQCGTVYDQLDQHQLSGDPVMDSVLGYYLTRARELGVDVTYQTSLRGPSGVNDVDMTVMLGNCLENAMEALEQLPGRQRRLDIEVNVRRQMLLLRIENSCAGADLESGDFVDWTGCPSGKRTSGLGTGLQSVTMIAEKYGGSAQFRRCGGVFTTRVFLSAPQNQPQDQDLCAMV